MANELDSNMKISGPGVECFDKCSKCLLEHPEYPTIFVYKNTSFMIERRLTKALEKDFYLLLFPVS